MKIITLDEAIAQSTPAPFESSKPGDYSDGIVILGDDRRIAVCYGYADAVMLAHCRNHLSPVVGALATILANPRRVERGIAKGCFDVGLINHVDMARAMEILSQAIKVKLP